MTPLSILQGALDVLARATLAGDWEAYRAGVALPYELRTRTAFITVTTEADLRIGFEQYHKTLRVLRVTDYLRLARDAWEPGPGLVAGEYETNLLSGGHRVLPPFPSVMTLREEGGRWLSVRVETDLLNARWPLAIPLPPPRAPSEGDA